MPRPVWTGAVSFGLVTIPIKVISATENHSVRFHRIHLPDMARVRNRKICEIDGQQVDQWDIAKGYELPGGEVIPLTEDELAALPLPTAKAIEIQAFVPMDSIDPIRIAEGYYLASNGPVAAKPYVLLLQALQRSGRVAVTKWAWNGRERLGILRVREGALVLHRLLWRDEVRDPDTLAPAPVDVGDSEIDEAVALIDAMTVDELEGPDFVDHYTEALEAIIAAKAEGAVLPRPEAEAPAEVVDLMTALHESVEKAKASRGEDIDGD